MGAVFFFSLIFQRIILEESYIVTNPFLALSVIQLMSEWIRVFGYRKGFNCDRKLMKSEGFHKRASIVEQVGMRLAKRGSIMNDENVYVIYFVNSIGLLNRRVVR